MKTLVSVIVFLLCGACFSQTPPSIQFTSVPGWGSTALLSGKVHNTSPGDHGVVVYIFVEEAGGWWNKPYAASPVSVIRPDSVFTTETALAGLDQYATKIIAFLTPLSWSPPVLSGAELPGELFSYPYVVSCRPHGDRVISWSGLEWVVKRSVGSTLLPIGPGPNIFNGSDTMVWVDSQQRLHLRIAKAGNKWHCTELIGKSSLGYNRYTFDVGSRVDLLDPNVIAGIFTWDDCSPLAIPPDNFYREIDFEFSRWGDPSNINSQFVIQPYDIAGNMNRFNMNLAGIDHSVHFFEWMPDSIRFRSAWGDSSRSWKYANHSYIPHPGNENIRINLHLFNAVPPLDPQDAELVLNSFLTGTSEEKIENENVRIFPNPFEQGCFIEVGLKIPGNPEIGILDPRGVCIKRMPGMLSAGKNILEWDGRAENGKPAEPGLYFLYLRDPFKTRYFKLVKI